MAEILTAKKLADKLTGYAIEEQMQPNKASILLAAAAMLRNQKTQINKLKQRSSENG